MELFSDIGRCLEVEAQIPYIVPQEGPEIVPDQLWPFPESSFFDKPRVVPQVSDEVVITPGSTDNQADQRLSSADHGKTRQKIGKSATSRNQNSRSQESSAQDDASKKEDAS